MTLPLDRPSNPMPTPPMPRSWQNRQGPGEPADRRLVRDRSRWVQDVLGRLERALERASDSRRSTAPAGLVFRSDLPGPIDPLLLWPGRGPRLRWRGRSGAVPVKDVVGVGSAHTLTVSPRADAYDLDDLRRRAGRWRRRCLTSEGTGAELLDDLAWFGGLAFDPQAEPTQRWSDFGAGRFFLPELSIEHFADGTGTITVAVDLAAPGVDTAMLRLTGHLGRLAFGPVATFDEAPPAQMPLGDLLRRGDSAARRRYERQVAQALRSITGDRLAKVVLARCRTVPAPARDELLSLRKLDGQHPDATVFAIGFEDDLFFGATPERLVALREGQVHTEALAGTRRRSEQVPHANATAKEQREHDLVIEEIVRRLRGRCRQVEVASTQIRTAGPLAHHDTPVRAVVRPGRDVLDLVSALHPTPAVCGLPTAPARHWIRRHEALDRGWYSGPIGWFDGRGEGDFAVALRCALGRRNTTHHFAGAGLVAGSDPEAEAREVDLKLDVLRDVACGRPTGHDAVLRR